MRALLLTVGTGTGVEHGIAFSIRSQHPEKVYFLCTKYSADKLPLIQEQLGYSEICLVAPPFHVGAPADFDRTYLDCIAALEQVQKDGYEPRDIAVDYTGGTKVMSAALVVAAAELGVRQFVYIDGLARGGEAMRVVSSTEQARMTGAGILRARRDLRLAPELFNRCQWDAAITVARRAVSECSIKEVCDRAQALETLATCYRHWDRFQHTKARETLRGLSHEHQQLLGVNLDANERFLGYLSKHERSAAGKGGFLLLADLLNNAQRRMDCGMWDDAVARLYRSAELLAQIRLAALDPPIDTARVPLERVPEPLRQEWAKRADEQGLVKSALVPDYELLQALGDPLGEWFFRDKALQDALAARNRTIGAHGFEAADERHMKVLMEKVAEKASELDPRVSEWRECATFVTLPG